MTEVMNWRYVEENAGRREVRFSLIPRVTRFTLQGAIADKCFHVI